LKNSIIAPVLFLCFLSSSYVYAKTIRVELNTPTTLDDIGVHITLLKSEPETILQLPEINSINAKFFDLFYTWDVKSDPNIDVMVIQKRNKDLLYIDINNDENLANDGPPLVFYHNENSISFNIISNHDKNQKTKFVLQRKPELPDSILLHFVDKYGNLNKKLAKQYGILKGDVNYQGEKGTFYFDANISSRKGNLQLRNLKIKIGLFDYNNNGLFNDEADIFMIDYNRDGKLTYGNVNENFKLNDVFSIDSQNYKIRDIDKYGNWLEIVETNEELTFYFLKENQEESTKMIKDSFVKGELDQSFWGLSFEGLYGNKIKMMDFKGKYLLLNFWGEWCKPCIEEIPVLVEIQKKIPQNKFEIISFARTKRVELLNKIIKKNKMNWTHILLTEKLIDKLKISSYPTNILIYNDGENYVKSHVINYKFIMSIVN
jgi:thiol-disulfide isomerase/thioredoxin